MIQPGLRTCTTLTPLSFRTAQTTLQRTSDPLDTLLLIFVTSSKYTLIFDQDRKRTRSELRQPSWKIHEATSGQEKCDIFSHEPTGQHFVSLGEHITPDTLQYRRLRRGASLPADLQYHSQCGDGHDRTLLHLKQFTRVM